MRNWITFLLILCAGATPASANKDISAGLPDSTIVSDMGNSIFMNGIPIKVVSISVSKSIKEVSSHFYKTWLEQGWVTHLRRHGDNIIVSASNRKFLKTATLQKTAEYKTNGTLSLTNLPERIEHGVGPDYIVGSHMPKPLNTKILNEVKVRDQKGESIMTTLTNLYDEEQNINFYRISMKDQGWSEKKFTRTDNSKNAILVFEKENQEATFTILRQGQQVFVTSNFLAP